MADKLNISLSAYNKLESGSSYTWAKYLENILSILDISYEDFFEGIASNYNITNKKGSIGGNIHVENLYADNKEKDNKIGELYETRISDKDAMITLLKDEVKVMKESNKMLKSENKILKIKLEQKEHSEITSSVRAELSDPTKEE
jgi:transcriptional regulator with XRE-family HTH domain